jgi:hypothetical protein
MAHKEVQPTQSDSVISRSISPNLRRRRFSYWKEWTLERAECQTKKRGKCDLRFNAQIEGRTGALAIKLRDGRDPSPGIDARYNGDMNEQEQEEYLAICQAVYERRIPLAD